MKLSIITINRNNATGLRKTIESVVSQTYTDFEYIVIDGASTDQSVEIINELLNKISYWVSEPDSGIYNAMNKGILKAKGEYCLFLNSGDWLVDKDVLSNVFSLDFNEDIVYGNQVIQEGGIYKKSIFISPEYLTFNSFLNSTLPHQCTFIKRKMFDKIGFYNEKNKIVSDWEWNALALFRYNCSLRKIEQTISCYDTTGISNNMELMEYHLEEKRKVLENNFTRILPDADNYFHLLKRYKKIPRIIAMVFNKLN